MDITRNPFQEYLWDYTQACKASQDPFELYQLLLLADNMNVGTVVEIGVDTGWLMLAWKQTLDAYVVGVDISTERFDPSTGMRGNLVVGDSGSAETVAEVCRRLMSRPIDLLFVDGDHYKDATLRDVELYSPMVRPGGLICVHDTSRIPGVFFDKTVETRWAFDELRKRYPSVEISNGPLGDGAPGIGVLFNCPIGA